VRDPGFPCRDDDAAGRVPALTLALNQALLGGNSATRTLEQWCETQRLVVPARIVAQRLPGPQRMPGPARRRRLRIRTGEHVRYRRVLLRCGSLILCEAENWYIPERLPPRMNHLLTRTSHPFGRVVHPLRFRRQNLSATFLWRAEPALGRAVPRQPILRHRALLILPSGLPFSEVVETFTSDLLSAPAHRAAPVRATGGTAGAS
jgi:chorismate-pyruvate lyase